MVLEHGHRIVVPDMCVGNAIVHLVSSILLPFPPPLIVDNDDDAECLLEALNACRVETECCSRACVARICLPLLVEDRARATRRYFCTCVICTEHYKLRNLQRRSAAFKEKE